MSTCNKSPYLSRKVCVCEKERQREKRDERQRETVQGFVLCSRALKAVSAWIVALKATRGTTSHLSRFTAQIHRQSCLFFCDFTVTFHYFSIILQLEGSCFMSLAERCQSPLIILTWLRRIITALCILCGHLHALDRSEHTSTLHKAAHTHTHMWMMKIQEMTDKALCHINKI